MRKRKVVTFRTEAEAIAASKAVISKEHPDTKLRPSPPRSINNRYYIPAPRDMSSMDGILGWRLEVIKP